MTMARRPLSPPLIRLALTLALVAIVFQGPSRGLAQACRNYLTAADLAVRFANPLPLAANLPPYYLAADGHPVFLLHAQEYTWQPTAGVCIPKWGFEGTTPGPTIRVASERPSEVFVLNELPERLYNPYFDPFNPAARVDPPSPVQTKYTLFGPNPNPPPPPFDALPYARSMYDQDPELTVHLHGGHQSPIYDGHPMDTFPPGRSHMYVYPNRQEPTTLWYHDHAMDHTRGHVLMGLAGVYVVESASETQLGLPTVPYDNPILFQRVPLEMLDQPQTPNRPIWAVNNALAPYLEVTNRPYRFRFLNGSDESGLRLWLTATPDDPRSESREAYLQQVGTDGGLMNFVAVEQPDYWRTKVRLFPAERADVVIDFSKVAQPTRFYLQAAALPAFVGGGGFGPDPTDETPQPLIEFRVNPTIPNPPHFDPPGGNLRPNDPITKLEGATRERTFVFGFHNLGTPPFATINDQFFDEHRVDATPELGATEIWHLLNPTDGYHPIHIHDIFFQVIERVDKDGNPTELQPGDWGSGNLAWKDVFVIPPFGRVTIIGRFTDNLGVYVFHCHNLVHEDAGMMSQFEVIQPGTPGHTGQHTHPPAEHHAHTHADQDGHNHAHASSRARRLQLNRGYPANE